MCNATSHRPNTYFCAPSIDSFQKISPRVLAAVFEKHTPLLDLVIFPLFLAKPD